MKLFLYGLYAVFLFAMGTGFYFAHRGAEGLVEENYYEKASGYFATKEREDSLGLKIVLPDSLHKGNNAVDVAVFLRNKPLRQAELSFFAGNVAEKSRHDAEYAMIERSPGVYRAEVSLPFPGKWLMRVDVESESITTNRKWFTEIE